MENSGQRTLLPISEETEEPWPKKMKIDRSHVSSKDEQQQLLQSLYYADKKSASKSLNFPEALWNFSQNGLELQEEKSANLNNVRRFVHFKQCMNTNLQSRLLGNIPFYEKLTPESNNCVIIRDASSDFNENNPFVTKSESWAKERSKSIDSGFILNGNELPTVNTIFYNIMIKSLIKTIESLFKNVPEFQSYENDNDCHHGHELFRSEEQCHILEPVTEGEKSNGKTTPRCLLASRLKKGTKSDLRFLFCENENGDEDDGDQYFTSTISHYLCKDQNIAVKEWHSKIALHGNRGKRIGFIFGNIKGFLQCQPKCNSKDSKYLKQPKNKKVGDENFLLQKYMLLSSTHSSKLESMKQNAEDVNKTEIEQSYTSKSHQQQNAILPYSKDESAIYLESKDDLMVVSHTRKEEHFEHTIKEYPLAECKDRYEFEMRNQFNLVLEELSMFNDIDKKNGTRLLCGETNILQEDALEQNHLDSIPGEDPRNVSENMTFSTCSTTLKYTMTVTQNENGQSLFKDTMLKQTGKQEVLHDYCTSSISDEELFCSPSEEHCDSGCKQLPPWKPAFVCHTFTKKQRCSYQNERGNYLYDGMIRVQPLKTCRGPLRIGLSRKAKLKQLHPYLK
ncbi:hypothetical protein lerEdw1_008738 [Lerista edwardsae]|nr:hypothetical protein lerEdw1_008738 [Lerista edwardsae]